MTKTTETVLVVGSGPVGLTMALELARYQVPVRLIDQMTGRSTASRAVAIWTRTLELLDRAGHGLSQELIAKGNKVTAASIVADGRLITRLDLKGTQSPYPFVLMLPQSDTEATLERHLRQSGARTEFGVELESFTQDETGVAATLRHGDGRVETERFGWLIACDGAHSPVRHRLGLSFEGETMGLDWTLGDFHMTDSPFPLDELGTYWHKDGPIVFFPMAPGRYRVIASLGPSTDKPPVVPTLGQYQALIDERGPGGIRLTDSIWTTAFRINERQVAKYRAGRVFLAGDAAHVHSPAGGQGMNTGMQDAVNLAWKLALVCRGIATSPALLDSYQAERHRVGAEVIAAAGRLTKMALVRNPVAQHIRNVVAHFMLGLAPVQHALAGSMTETSIGYPDSPLNGSDRGSPRRAGSRILPAPGEPPFGAGDTPRFVIHADPPIPPLPGLADPRVRANADAARVDIIRPDGYLAMSVPDGDWPAVEHYLHRLM